MTPGGDALERARALLEPPADAAPPVAGGYLDLLDADRPAAPSPAQRLMLTGALPRI